MDYLNKIEDIDYIYELGVRSTNIVWNNENKFGGGTKADKRIGLTSLGIELVEKIIKTNIAIDLSHANEKTFYDIINVCKKMKQNKYSPIIFASHSNCKSICDCARNLSDNQLLEIKKLGGTVGIVGIKQFCLNYNTENKEYIKAYINNINHLKQLKMIDNIAIATDNMEYYITNKKYYKNMMIFNQESIKKDICMELKKENYSNLEIEKIIHINFENKILQRL